MPTATAADSIQLALLQAIEDGDDDGFALLEQLAVAQLGPDQALEVLCSLIRLVPSDLVPTTLRLIHGDGWIDQARAVIFAAGVQLISVGAVLGRDYSFSALFSGEPRLLMSAKLYQAILEEQPDAFNIIRAFLLVEDD